MVSLSPTTYTRLSRSWCFTTSTPRCSNTTTLSTSRWRFLSTVSRGGDGSPSWSVSVACTTCWEREKQHRCRFSCRTPKTFLRMKLYVWNQEKKKYCERRPAALTSCEKKKGRDSGVTSSILKTPAGSSSWAETLVGVVGSTSTPGHVL